MSLSFHFHKIRMHHDLGVVQLLDLSHDQLLSQEMVYQVDHRNSLICQMDYGLLVAGWHNNT